MKIGDEIEIEIADLAFGGRGVGRVGGLAVFVRFVAVGERVVARVARVKGRWAEADLVRVVEVSGARVTPRCQYFGRCGGCAYQHLAYDEQLLRKRKQVADALARIGGFEGADGLVAAAVGAPSPFGYRNRIRVHARGGEVGFFGVDGRTLVDVARCEIASDTVNARLADARRGGARDGEIVLAERGAGGFFRQTNPAVAERMREAVGRLLPPEATVLVDAYCGAGFFARAFAGRFSRVVGIEADARAVRAAREGAGATEEYVCGKVEEELGRVLGGVNAASVVLVADPPASGMGAAAVAAVVAARPGALIYVSCDPATFARDARALAEAYELRSATPFDMFPQTAEIELVAAFVARAAGG